MLIKKPDDIHASQITSEGAYLNRRSFMRAAVLLSTTAATGYVYRRLNRPSTSVAKSQRITIAQTQPSVDPVKAGYVVAGEDKTPFDDITHYNNFYEFSTDKEAVAEESAAFVSRPWTVRVDGLCRKPRTFDLDELLQISPAEERIYRHRCVEGWSMVIPWIGFPLARLLEKAEPSSDAKFVAFTTLLDPNQMRNQRRSLLEWPYVEGLRMDEAMHPLTILASGLYGRTLPAQNGAPLRLVTPWKYGFKGIKSIVQIRFVSSQPPTTWSGFAPSEYGFYSNVNPQVDHPRWSQVTERRIGELGRRKTLMFNGYAEQVASLYAGMDLNRFY